MTGCLICLILTQLQMKEAPKGCKFAEGSYMDISILWLPSHRLGICSSWKLMLCHKLIFYFCHRIASECIMVISSGQCVFVVSLFY